MGWDQSTGCESVEQFLLRELDIDLNALIVKAIAEKLSEKDLTFEAIEDTSRWEGDEMSGQFHPWRIEFSDGRVFVTALTHQQMGDDWGNESFTFVEAGKPFELHRSEYVGRDDDPQVSVEEMQNLEGMSSPHTPEIKQGEIYSLDEVREQGGKFGGAIADFFSGQGIEGVSFEPGDEEIPE